MNIHNGYPSTSNTLHTFSHPESVPHSISFGLRSLLFVRMHVSHQQIEELCLPSDSEERRPNLHGPTVWLSHFLLYAPYYLPTIYIFSCFYFCFVSSLERVFIRLGCTQTITRFKPPSKCSKVVPEVNVHQAPHTQTTHCISRNAERFIARFAAPLLLHTILGFLAAKYLCIELFTNYFH